MALSCLMLWVRPEKVKSQLLTDSTANYYSLSEYYDKYYDSLIQLRGNENMQGTGYKDYLRWKWFYYTRHGVDGELDEIWKSIENYFEEFQMPQGYTDNSDWQFVGPLGIPLGHGGNDRGGTGKGMMLSIWVGGGDHSLIFAGSHHGGLWKTIDGGLNWFPLHDNDARIHGVNSIAVDPEDNETIYITCNNSMSDFSNYSSGVFKSVDGGLSWIKLMAPDSTTYPTNYFGASLRQIKIHPTNSDILFLTTYKNVFKSLDQGITWQRIFDKNYYKWEDTDSTNFDNHNGLFDLEVDCLNDSLYYLAGSELFLINDSLNIIDTTNITQDVLLIGLDPGDSLLSRPHRAAVTVDDHFPGIAWFCYVADYEINDTAISLLRIVEYSSINQSFDLIFEDNNLISAGGSMLDFEASHADTSIVDFYIGAVGILKTDLRNGIDSTLTLDLDTYPGNCWLHVDKRDLFLFSDHMGHDTLYIANDAGISWGTPYEIGQTGCGNNEWHWRHPMASIVNGLNVTEFYGIGISELESDLVAGGCQDINNMLLKEGQWINFGEGDGSQLEFDPENKAIFYFSEWQSATLFRTNNSGMSYDNSGFYNLDESTVIMPIELDPVDPSILYSGDKSLLKFIDVDDFSQEVEEPIELEHFNNVITDIEAVRYGGSRRILVSTDKAYYPWNDPPPPDSLHFSGSVYLSDNNGNSFLDISDSLPGCLNGFVADIEVNPDQISTIWVSCVGFSKDATQLKKVFKSSNSGGTWMDYSQGLPAGLPVFRIRYIPEFGFLLAATDVGIFKRTSQDTAWMPFSNGLPQKIITDLEVNKEYNTIVASTYGRGIWKTPILCEYNETPWTIRDNLEWEKDTILNCSMEIDENISVTLSHCKIFMPADAKIVVKRGAKLLLDSCTLTSACNDLWWGIEVWGNGKYLQNSGVQGRIELINNSTIEKARKAVFCGKNIEDTYPDWAYTGGIVDASESTFKNNRYAVQLWTYRNPQSLARFEACKFQTNQILADGSSPEYFMTLVQVNGVEIKGCNFEYEIDGVPEFKEHGRGIYAVDAGFEVMPDANYNPCTFKDLDCGIFTLKLYENKPLLVHDSYFSNNLTGIYASAIENLQIYLNEFYLNFDSIPSGSQIFGGVYLDNCTGYMVEENTFGNFMVSSQSPSIGITINNSGEAFNEVYKNTFNKLFIGTLAQNINRNVKYFDDGLKLTCNIYNQNEYDVVVTGAPGCNECGISKLQGSPSNPAGNLFSKTGLHPTSDFDNLMDSVTYYHHRPELIGTNQWIPYYISDSVYPTPTQVQWSDTTCSSRLPSRNKEFIQNLYTTSLSTSDSLNDLLQQLVDGGNTSLLEMDVAFAEPDDALDLHDELLNFSPYLSDTILVKSVEKEDVLAPLMVKDIMVANPQSAKSPKVLEALENRENELPDYMMSEILLGKDSVGHKEMLESDLSYWKLQMEISMNQLIHFYRMDTLAASNDSVILLLENANSLQAQYRLMIAYFDNDDTVSALSTYESIHDQFDLDLAQNTIHQHWNGLVDILVGLKRDANKLYELDSNQLATLTDLSSVEDLPGNISRNILHYLELAETGPYYILPVNQLKSSHHNADPLIGPVIIQKSFIKFYPNPAKNYIFVEYTFINNSSEGNLFIYSSDGKLQFTKSLNRNKHDCIINTRDWEQGIYFYKFILLGEKDQNGKILILK